MLRKKVIVFLITIILVCSTSIHIMEAETSPYDKRKNNNFGATSPSVYYRGQLSFSDYLAACFSEQTTSEAVYNLWDKLVEKNQKLIEKIDLGLCSDGISHIYEYDIIPQTYKWTNEKVKKQSPTVLIISGQHGDEKASSMGLYFFVLDLLENADKNDSLGWLKANVCFKIIPICNPYGWNRNDYLNSNGVNLNRNYDTIGFPAKEEAKSGEREYGGEYPFDQLETQKVKAFVQDNLEAVLFIDFHTYGHEAVESAWYINWNELMDVDDDYYIRANYAIASHINRQTVEFQKQYSINIGNLCVGYQTLGDASFPSADAWVTSQNIIGITVEGFSGFPGGELYTAEVLQANSQIIGNVIINLICELKR